MNSAGERIERRKHKRYNVDNGALVLLGWYYEKVGRIIDISMGGLAFRFLPHGEEQDESDLAIVMSEANFYLDEVPARTVWELELADEIPVTRTHKRRGVQFMGPTDSQKAQIEFFIKNYTDRKAELPDVDPQAILEELAKVRTDFRS
jgi:hypothetical protein